MIKQYLELSDSQRLRGMIPVTDNTQEALVTYSKDDMFAK